MGKSLSSILQQKGYEHIKVFYDHGCNDDPNCCRPTTYFDDYSTATTLAQIDLAIVDVTSGNVSVICEIEEEGASPKKILGDIFSILLAENVMIKRKKYQLNNFHYILGVRVPGKGLSSEKIKKIEKKFRIFNYIKD